MNVVGWPLVIFAALESIPTLIEGALPWIFVLVAAPIVLAWLFFMFVFSKHA